MAKSEPFPNEFRRKNEPIVIMSNTLRGTVDASESNETTVENFYTIGD